MSDTEQTIKILAIESSCDETAAAVVVNGRDMRSNVISSQIALHTLYGGVVPEIASRKHIEKINQVIAQALSDADMTLQDMDAIGVTYGPGLVGALLVGVAEAKAISYAANIPLVGVHHIEGHISANYIENPDLKPPFLCLVVSGGHTHLVKVTDYGTYEILGRTRDDAAGEAFDKVARAIGLGYPGGPKIEKVSHEGDPKAISFPRAKIADGVYDFSFSGLKSAVLNYLNGCRMKNLVIPYGEGIPSDIVPMLKKMVEHQVQIYFLDALPDVMLGFSKNQEAFEYVQTHASVIALEQLGETLAEYRKVFFAQVQPDLAVGEYERDGQRYYMIFNENIGKTIRTEISLPHAEHVYRYDAFSGKTYEVSTDPASGKFFLSLEPYESVVLLESEENLPAEAVYFKGADMAADQEKIALPEKWNVQFADSFSWPKFTEKVPVEELCCVQEIAGWEKKAGTLQFSSELKLEYEISAVLDLGEVFETAEVKVNGISAGLRLCRPYRFDLTGLLKKGENQITIEVTNCLGTALRDPISHYLMIEPFGIEGPVVMKKIQK